MKKKNIIGRVTVLFILTGLYYNSGKIALDVLKPSSSSTSVSLISFSSYCKSSRSCFPAEPTEDVVNCESSSPTDISCHSNIIPSSTGLVHHCTSCGRFWLAIVCSSSLCSSSSYVPVTTSAHGLLDLISARLSNPPIRVRRSALTLARMSFLVFSLCISQGFWSQKKEATAIRFHTPNVRLSSYLQQFRI